MRVIELFEKSVFDDNMTSVIAECNMYDENNILIQQLSRSPFIFPNTMSDAEIITTIQTNEYSIYF
jgi:hypothetical protein